MKKLDIASWYGEHSTQVLLAYAITPALLWYFYFEPIDRQELTLIPIAIVAVIYFWSAKYLKNFCYETISHYAQQFSNKPTIKNPTSEELIDRIDIDIISKIDELREEKGDYFKVLDSVDIVDSEELLQRLGKLKYLGYVHCTRRRVSLTGLGLEYLDSSSLPKAIVPPRFSVLLARAKINLDEGNFNGVLDSVNILFEDILRSGIEEKLGDQLDEKWAEFRKDKKVIREFDRASLGHLLTACLELRIIIHSSIVDNIISSFLKLRIPQKHSLDKDTNPQQDAKTALDMANIVVREWFKK